MQKENNIRKFQHFNIIKHLDPYNLDQIKEEIGKDFHLQNINTKSIKINPGSEFSIKNYALKSVIVPNCNFTLIKDHMIQTYKAIKFSKNFNKINTVFLIGYSYGSQSGNVYLYLF